LIALDAPYVAQKYYFVIVRTSCGLSAILHYLYRT